MKRHLTTLLLITTLISFIIFIKITSNNKTVESVLTPTKITLTNNNKRTISNKTYCLDNIEAFSLDMTGEFIHKYSKKYNLPMACWSYNI